jgi:hypothetical protein
VVSFTPLLLHPRGERPIVPWVGGWVGHRASLEAVEYRKNSYPTRTRPRHKLKRLVAGFPPRRSGFEPWSGHVGFVVDKVVLRQVFFEYFGFRCQSSFHQLLHNHPHLSSGACTIGHKWPQYLVDLVPPH